MEWFKKKLGRELKSVAMHAIFSLSLEYVKLNNILEYIIIDQNSRKICHQLILTIKSHNDDLKKENEIQDHSRNESRNKKMTKKIVKFLSETKFFILIRFHQLGRFLSSNK